MWVLLYQFLSLIICSYLWAAIFCYNHFCSMLRIHAPSQIPTHTFSLSQKGSQVHAHTISICPIDTLLCVSRLRGNRRQLRALGLPLVAQPTQPRRMGWRRVLHVGARHSGTPRAWILSSLKQVSLCVIPLQSQDLLQPSPSEVPVIRQAQTPFERPLRCI